MQNINTTITNNFHRNIDYIEKHHPELFSKLSSYDAAVENQHYIEKYELVYENGNFDVYEKATNTYLYKKQSQHHAQLAADSIDYTVEENVFQGVESVQVSDEQEKEYLSKEAFTHHMSGFASIINYTQKHSSHPVTLKKLFKYVFFGTGLGLHLNTIDKKIDAKVYLIIEDDLELFRLSLFTTDYTELAKNAKLFFSIFEEQNEFTATAELFLKEQYFYNYYIKYFHILSHNDEKRTQLHIAIGSQSHQLFFYHHLLLQYLKPLDYMFNKYKFLHNSLDFSLLSKNDRPFLLLAAGPSLQKHIQWVQENQKHFIIVALSATLSTLEAHNITPDIITHLDGFDAASIHFTKLKEPYTLQNALCFFSDRSSKEALAHFKKEQIYFFENGTRYKTNSLKPSAPCVGSLSFQLLLILKVKSFYLLGLDLAIDAKTGATHSDDHTYNNHLNTQKKLSEETILTYKESLFQVKGNLQPYVLTTSHFKSSIDAINLSASLVKQKFQTVYNLSDGAQFLETIPKNIYNVQVKEFDKTAYIHKIKNHLKQDALEEFLSTERTKLKSKLTKAQQFQKELFIYQNESFKSTQEFLAKTLQLTQILTNAQVFKEEEISRVFDTYLRYILPYIFDFFNHNDKKDDKDIVKIHHSLSQHLLQIVKYYMKHIDLKLT